MEAIQKGPGVADRRLFKLPPLQCLLELSYIAADYFSVEPQISRADEDIVRAEVLAQGIERLVESPTRSFLLGVGPEVSQHLLPGKPLLTCGCQQGEHGKPARLRRRAADHAIRSADVESPEGIYL